MIRRYCLMGLVAGATTARRAPGQQRSKPARVAILTFGSPEAPYLDALKVGLRDLGWVENSDVVFEIRAIRGQFDRMPALVKETVASSPDVIWAIDTATAVLCKQATSTIPIVFAGSADPIGAGLVQSLSRPGGNATGQLNHLADLGPKLLELLHSIVPGLSRVAALVSPHNPVVAQAATQALQAAGAHLKLVLVPFSATTANEIDQAFARMKLERIDGLVIPEGAVYVLARQQIGELLIRHRIAAAVSLRELLRGALVSYGDNALRRVRDSATYLDKILRGTKPADLPVEQPMRLELVVNLQTAKALGLAVPQSLLLRADEVVG
ncbi:MAG TPA: ABC transporter substrate-binding protein [Burkholderiaceae bacterium]|nr:ABC transporter substrate-binding protein [Burkholderiaceae bacterium]